MILKIAICEDEVRQINIIKGYIDAISSKYPNFYIKTDEYRSGNLILAHYQRTGKHDYYDIIFFDKDLGDSDGIETAHKIREFDSNVLFVYITKFTQFINDASETDMFRYLTKPLLQEKFNKAFEFAIKRIDAREKTFTFTSNYTPFRIFAKDIIYFERFGMKTTMYTSDGATHNMLNLLRDIADELGNYGFMLVHRSLVVNLAYIKEVRYEHLVLHNKTKLNVSRMKSPLIKSRFLAYNYEKKDV